MFKAGSRVPSCRWTLPWYHYGFPRARKSVFLASVAGLFLFLRFPLTCLPIKDGRGFSPGHLCLASPFVFLRFCLCSTFLVSRVCVHSSQGLGVEFFTLMVSRGCKKKEPHFVNRCFCLGFTCQQSCPFSCCSNIWSTK